MPREAIDSFGAERIQGLHMKLLWKLESVQEEGWIIIDQEGKWYLHRAVSTHLKKKSVLGASFFGADICYEILWEDQSEWLSIDDLGKCLEYVGVGVVD